MIAAVFDTDGVYLPYGNGSAVDELQTTPQRYVYDTDKNLYFR